MKRKEYDHKYDNFSPISLSSSSSKTRRLDPDLIELPIYEDPISRTVSEVIPEEPIENFHCNNDKAIVLYNPNINATLYKSPSVSADFSVVVNSDLIPSFKEMVRSLEQRTTTSQENHWAVVPWVGPAAAEEAEGEEVEMMDAEMSGETAGELQQWQHQQQHCLRPELFHSAYTPVPW